MKAVYYSVGDTIPYVPSSDVPAGAVVILSSNVFGVTRSPILANQLGSLATTGVFDIEKDAAATFNVGDAVYWDPTAQKAFAANATGRTLIGYCYRAAGASDARVRTKLSSR